MGMNRNVNRIEIEYIQWGRPPFGYGSTCTNEKTEGGRSSIEAIIPVGLIFLFQGCDSITT